MLRILFVCTGNTCRSPMAEGLCRSFLGRLRLQQEVEVASAGLNAVAGGPASREAVAIMAERGIDLSGHKTACLTDEQVRWADLILTMEEHHRRRLLEQFPEAVGKAFVLKEYAAAPTDEAPAAQVGINRAGTTSWTPLANPRRSIAVAPRRWPVLSPTSASTSIAGLSREKAGAEGKLRRQAGCASPLAVIMQDSS